MFFREPRTGAATDCSSARQLCQSTIFFANGAAIAAMATDVGYYRQCRMLSPMLAVVALISVVMSAIVADV
jgi:hypothetical protein